MGRSWRGRRGGPTWNYRRLLVQDARLTPMPPSSYLRTARASWRGRRGACSCAKHGMQHRSRAVFARCSGFEWGFEYLSSLRQLNVDMKDIACCASRRERSAWPAAAGPRPRVRAVERVRRATLLVLSCTIGCPSARAAAHAQHLDARARGLSMAQRGSSAVPWSSLGARV